MSEIYELYKIKLKQRQDALNNVNNKTSKNKKFSPKF